MKSVILKNQNGEKFSFELLSKPKDVYFYNAEKNIIQNGLYAKARQYFNLDDTSQPSWEQKYRQELLQSDSTENLSEIEIESQIELKKRIISSWQDKEIIYMENIIYMDGVIPPFEGYDSPEECRSAIVAWYQKIIEEYKEKIQTISEANISSF